MWMTNELLLKKLGVFFFSKVRWSPSPSKVEGPHEVILWDFPFLMEQATCALISFLFQIHPVKLYMHNHHLILRGKNPTQVGHHMWKILASKFWSYIWATLATASKNKQCQLNKKSTCLEFVVFICYFGSHGSGHQPTVVGTFIHVDYCLVGHKPN